MISEFLVSTHESKARDEHFHPLTVLARRCYYNSSFRTLQGCFAFEFPVSTPGAEACRNPAARRRTSLHHLALLPNSYRIVLNRPPKGDNHPIRLRSCEWGLQLSARGWLLARDAAGSGQLRATPAGIQDACRCTRVCDGTVSRQVGEVP